MTRASLVHTSAETSMPSMADSSAGDQLRLADTRQRLIDALAIAGAAWTPTTSPTSVFL
jgi:hypothetical protein